MTDQHHPVSTAEGNPAGSQISGASEAGHACYRSLTHGLAVPDGVRICCQAQLHVTVVQGLSKDAWWRAALMLSSCKTDTWPQLRGAQQQL